MQAIRLDEYYLAEQDEEIVQARLGTAIGTSAVPPAGGTLGQEAGRTVVSRTRRGSLRLLLRHLRPGILHHGHLPLAA